MIFVLEFIAFMFFEFLTAPMRIPTDTDGEDSIADDPQAPDEYAHFGT